MYYSMILSWCYYKSSIDWRWWSKSTNAFFSIDCRLSFPSQLNLQFELQFCFRYYAVTAPITYSQHKDKHGRVYAFILICWLASIAIGKQECQEKAFYKIQLRCIQKANILMFLAWFYLSNLCTIYFTML